MKKALLLSICSWLITSPVQAADFYDGKTITIIVGFTPGGTFDQIAPFYARNLPKFIPGRPNIVVQNMPGAGGVRAMLDLCMFAEASRNDSLSPHPSIPFSTVPLPHLPETCERFCHPRRALGF